MTTKQYMFVVTACDGRHEHKHGTWEEAHADAAKWLDKPLESLLGSYEEQYGRGRWETAYGQVTSVEVVGEYDAFVAAEFGDEDDDD